jgi:hypothetical protein
MAKAIELSMSANTTMCEDEVRNEVPYVPKQNRCPLAVGDHVEFWITGIARTFQGRIAEVRDDGPHIQVIEPGWPILKPTDYIIRWPRKADP